MEEAEVAMPVVLENLKRHITSSNDFFGADQSVAFSIDALKRITPKNASFLNVLMIGAGVTNQKGNNRILALIALGEIASEHSKSLPQIKKALSNSLADRNPKIRVAALKGLGQMGKNAKDMPTLNAIKRLKLDSDAEVREAATATLEKLQDD